MEQFVNFVDSRVGVCEPGRFSRGSLGSAKCPTSGCERMQGLLRAGEPEYNVLLALSRSQATEHAIMNHAIRLTLSCAASLSLLAHSALADGSETLGPPSIAIASGTDVIAAGVGLTQAQPGSIDFDVPAGATVVQVLLYWEGFMATAVAGDDTVLVNGIPVTGTLIGGPDFFFIGATSSTFRQDITGLGLVGPGSNSLQISGMDFTSANNGAGVFVIIDDGSEEPTPIQIRDGNDTAFVGFAPPRMSTVAQTFGFAAAATDRTADLCMFFSSVSGSVSTGTFRPSTIEVTVDAGPAQAFTNLLDSNDGEEWDTVCLPILIPAGATSLTVQALSEDRDNIGGRPASFVWNASALSVPGDEPPPPGDCETAYGFGEDTAICFLDMDPPGRDFNNWGWGHCIGQGTFTWDLIAGAGQCTGGTVVGTVTVVYDGTSVSIDYAMNEGFVLEEVHVEVNDQNPWAIGSNGNPTVAPGQYTFGDASLDGADGFSVTLEQSGNPIYVIAHAVTCEETAALTALVAPVMPEQR